MVDRVVDELRWGMDGGGRAWFGSADNPQIIAGEPTVKNR